MLPRDDDGVMMLRGWRELYVYWNMIRCRRLSVDLRIRRIFGLTYELVS